MKEISRVHYVGEVAGLKRINEKDLSDLNRMWDIEMSEGRTKWMGSSNAQSKSELARFIRIMNKESKKNGKYNMYAITAQENRDSHELLPREERGMLEGRIRTDETQEELERYQRILGCTVPKNYPPPIEFGYIRRPGGPPKLMGSAVRQLCLQILKEDTMKKGFVDEIQDENGWRIVPKRPIMLFIDKDNIKSREVAVSAGFEIVREGVSWAAGDESNDDMYILNWDKLQEIVENETKSTIFKKLNPLSRVIGKLDIITDTIPPPNLKK